MTEPTKEMIREWIIEIDRESGINKTPERVPRGYIELCRRAASWAREQALEEAAKVCDHEWNGDSSSVDYDQACNDCAQAIRALKEKANEHAPIPR